QGFLGALTEDYQASAGGVSAPPPPAPLHFRLTSTFGSDLRRRSTPAGVTLVFPSSTYRSMVIPLRCSSPASVTAVLPSHRFSSFLMSLRWTSPASVTRVSLR